MLNIIKNFLQKDVPAQVEANVVTTHGIDPKLIDKHAVKVMQVIHEHGYQAYLVGGAVRDLLVGIKPKDFDIATNAHPEVVQKMFKGSLLIGRRFKLVHVRFGRDIIEVATFRGEYKGKGDLKRMGKRGMLLRDNVFGSIDTDVWRRDFTVNALYYNGHTNAIIDYMDALHDIQGKTLRVIGSPQVRYEEDPVRMLRALRYSAKLGFTIESSAYDALIEKQYLLEHVSPERILVEVIKTFYSGFAMRAFVMLKSYGVLNTLFPRITPVMEGKEPGYNKASELIERACYLTDARYMRGDTLSNAYLFIVLLWPLVQSTVYKSPKNKKPFIENVQQAIDETLNQHGCPIAIPRVILDVCEQVWLLQYQFTLRESDKIGASLKHPKFRMAYDFLMLRAQLEPELCLLATWWFNYQHAESGVQTDMVAAYTERVKRRNNTRSQQKFKRRPSKSRQ